MKRKNQSIPSKLLCELVVKGMQEKKAENIQVIELKTIKNAVSDYFVVCSGTSDNHADAIADSVEDMVFDNTGSWPWHSEGRNNKEWILIDYVDVVAHVFRKDIRTFYALEDLYGDAKISNFDTIN